MLTSNLDIKSVVNFISCIHIIIVLPREGIRTPQVGQIVAVIKVGKTKVVLIPPPPHRYTYICICIGVLGYGSKRTNP